VSGTLTTGFTYNGAGDRVAKTVDGVETRYTLDPAAGLPQVLQETTDGQATSYLYGHDGSTALTTGLLAQYDSGTWAYHVNDGLGSVRQLADPVGQVVQGYSFSPFGVPLGESGGEPYGFTGEQWDQEVELLYLRARYYKPLVGRFITKDVWPGDYQNPQSLNGFSYVENNPINATDPSGWYGREVHYDLTYGLVLEWAAILPTPVDPERLAYHIAWADQYVDDALGILDAVSCNVCHFCPLDRTMRHVEATIESGNPFLFGASLHQLQDWFSHWNEGYTFEHARDTIRAGEWKVVRTGRTWIQIQDFYWGYHILPGPPFIGFSPFRAHPREEVIQDIQRRNPGIDLNGLSDNDLIDLYLRKDAPDPNSSLRIKERDYFGFATDLYFPGSSRDRDMEHVTRAYILRFMRRITDDPCALNFRQPDDAEIKAFLSAP